MKAGLPRLIPVLLLSEEKLVKTKNFANETYVGDPVNVLSIFNEFEVDEIILIDISRSRNFLRKSPLTQLRRIVTESFIPLAFGGGIRTAEQAEEIVSLGIEKVVLNSLIFDDPGEVSEAVRRLGSQAVVAALDLRTGEDGQYEVWAHGATKKVDFTVEEWCRFVSELGVGEILVTNVDREGTRKGIDFESVRKVSDLVSIPVIAHGGAGLRSDLVEAISEGGASAVAAGSLFLFKGGRDSVLINYPSKRELSRLFLEERDDQLAHLPRSTETSADIAQFDLVPNSQTEMCRTCIITNDVPGANFDSSGACYYCHVHKKLDDQNQLGPASDRALRDFVSTLKAEGRGKKYDCVLGVSGGTDSSYLAHLLVQHGVRPLAVHFDNTWNSPIATANIYAVLGKLNIDLETYVVDNNEYDDIYLSFLKAGVKDIEAPTDIGFMGTLYRAAEKHGIRHIVEGHSFRTEGISPIGWLYMDGGYIKDVHKKFGTVPMRTYPNMEFSQFVKWSAFSGIQRTRPLYWVDYKKERVKKFLSEEYGWEWYGGHHLENRFTAFYHSYFLPTRFGINFRQIELSALVRSGQLVRDVAIRQFSVQREADPALISLVKKRLSLTDSEFKEIMTLPKKLYTDFRTYKRRFELLKPFFWILLKLNRIPESFYLKFCGRAGF